MAKSEVSEEPLPEAVSDLEVAGRGEVFTILHCKGALKSYGKAIARTGKKKRVVEKRLSILLNWLGNNVEMSKENFPKEGLLPDGSHFRALKKIPVRAYLWRSSKFPRMYFISHYVYKDYDDLHPTDTEKVCNNWRLIEEDT